MTAFLADGGREGPPAQGHCPCFSIGTGSQVDLAPNGCLPAALRL